jgi:hypothetical protein
MISCTRRLVEGDEKEINFVFCGRCAAAKRFPGTSAGTRFQTASSPGIAVPHHPDYR